MLTKIWIKFIFPANEKQRQRQRKFRTPASTLADYKTALAERNNSTNTMEHARYLEWREKYQSLNQKEDRPFSSYRDNKNSRKQYLRSGSVPITRGLKGKSHRRTVSTCVKHNEIEEYEDYNSRFQRTMSKTTCRTTAGARTPIRPIVASGSQLKDEEIVEAPQPDSTASTDRITKV